MKLIYLYNDQRQLDHSELVDDDYQLPANATDIRPQDGLYEPLTFTGSDWTGVTREEWLANQPEPEPTQPTEQDKINAQLLMADATNRAAQDKFNAQIMLEIANAKGGN
ncbi:hypothetical protein [Lapidilactobacillus bayanensis]|uniref:hypothetical protein n=1 Tax=Lapidilactobacillus bayanensis TaxID=2485998 RepID=UPI000F77C028|nr:hypothetical protein [Lapidilactobacillus bayanensis]